MAQALTKQDKELLRKHEETIKTGLTNFFEVGHALTEIRDRKLYLEGYANFKEYCEKRWDLGTRHAQRLMRSAEVYDNIKDQPGSTNATNWSHSKDKNGSKLPEPETESQVRPLVGLEPEKQQEAWGIAVESANGHQPTAKQVETAVEIVREPGDDTEQINADKKSQQNKARNNGKPVFDDRPFGEIFGKLVRFIDSRGIAYSRKGRYEECRKHLNGLLSTYTDWKKETT